MAHRARWELGDDGNSRGLILVNLDTQQPCPVDVRFEGVAAAPAQSWTLTADQIAASNEFEQPESQVRVRESQLTGFQSGSRVTVPPFSMVALRWQLR